MGMQVARWLRAWAERTPSTVALTDRSTTPATHLTYAELDARAARVAHELAACGLLPGERLALVASNGVDFAATFYGALYAGLVVLPIPTASAEAEVAFRLRHARVAHVVCDGSHEPLVRAAARDLALGVHLASALGRGGARADALDLPTDATAILLYTSGTTATPKAACITHASLAVHTSAIVHHVLHLGATDVVLGAIPFTHSYGLRMALLAPLFAGARTVVLPRFSTRAVRDALVDERVTWFPGVPTMFSALGRDEAEPYPALRSCLSAGAPLAPSIRERAERALGVAVHEGYGLTEATFTSIGVDGDVGTVGRPVPGVEVRVVDDEGASLPTGTLGEIVVRGQNVMAGYFEDDAATTAAFRDGWLTTGDLGTLDEDGRVRVVDRKKDLIIRGGFNVVPAEVEAALVSHPAIEGALVVGIPDAHLGEEIVAVLTTRHGLDIPSLVAHLRSTIASTKHPRLFAVVDALPIGPSGKALRRSVRDAITSGVIVPTHLVGR